MAVSPITQAIINGARARGLDPNAVLAVSKQEGLSGGIGDGGHAFGPFQLNNAGGVITGKFAGETPEQIQQWAMSPAGLDYALNGIAKVAAGLHGAQAVNAIVSRFERPLNPQREIQGALSAYGAPLPSGPAMTPGPAPGTTHPAQLGGPTTPSPLAAALRLLAQSSTPAPRPVVAPTLPPAPVTPFQASPTTLPGQPTSPLALMSPQLLARFAAAPRT